MNWKYIIPAILVFAACESTEKNVTAKAELADETLLSVVNPIEGTDAAPRNFEVSASKAQTIDLGNGGSIEFPDNAFVDQKGKPVKGKVDVQWQEFHSLGDIMLSGIPMKYDSAGVQFDLVSGGMFTINASQKGKPVEIAPSKKVNVNVASIQDTPCYNFYEMDEKSGKWDYETTKLGAPIKSETAEVKETETPDLLDVNLKTKDFPELAKLDIVGWEVKRPLKSGEKNVLQLQSTKLRLVKTDSLGLTLEAKTNGKQTLRYPVAPYTMDQAMLASKKNRKEMTEGFAETRKHAAEMLAGRVVRSIEIDNFGTFNWDIVCTRKNPKKLIANFNLPKNTDPKLVSLFLLSPDENAIVAYNPGGDNNFSFDPNMKNCLIAILPGNKVASLSNEGFNHARTLKNGQLCEFTLKDTGIKLKSAKDIMNHMSALL